MRSHVFFLISFGFRGSVAKSLLSIAIMGLFLWSMVKSEAENDMGCEFLRTSSDGLSLCDDKELSW
jgi:hypothetical protein